MSSMFGDLGSAVVIILIFSILHGVLAVSVGIKEVQENWQYYKCNPGIMPFASVFGHDLGDNFRECIQSSQVDFMGGFLEPIFSSLSFLAEQGAVFAELFEKMKVAQNQQDSARGAFMSDTQGRLSSMTEAGSDTYIAISQAIGKLGSILPVISNILNSAIDAGEASRCELVGTVVEFGTGETICGE